jgi:hypothetical protein
MKKTRLFLICTGIILLVFGVQAISGAEEQKRSCLASDGAVIKVSDSAFMRINYQSQFAAAWRDTGSGRDNADATTDLYFRRNRLTVSGQASHVIGYSIDIEHAGDRRIGAVEIFGESEGTFDVIDAYMSADLGPAFKVKVGKTKIPFTREVLDGCFSALTVDRSLFIATPAQRTRDTGLVAWGNLAGSKLQYAAAIQEGQESGGAPGSVPRYTGRVHVALLDPEDSLGYSGTYLGNKMVLTIGAAAQYEQDVVYSDIHNKTGEKDYEAWTADIFLEYPVGLNGSLTLSAAYMEMNFDNAYQGSAPDPISIGLDGEKRGWYGKAGYLFIDKMGPGQLQPFLRYEKWDFALLNDVFAQSITWMGGGINYLINGQSLKLALEYAETDFKDEENADSRDFKTITSMLQFAF